MSKTIFFATRPLTGKLTITQLSLAVSFMKWTQRAVFAVVIGVAGLVVIQVCYPSSYTRPLMHVGGQSAGIQDTNALAQTFEEVSAEKVKVVVGPKTYEVSHAQLGVVLDDSAAADQLKSYPLTERLVPFTLFASEQDQKLAVKIDQAKLTAFIEQASKENTKPAIDAKATKKADGTYELSASVNGQSFNPEDVKNQITNAPVTGGGKISIKPEITTPAITTDKFQAAIDEIYTKAKNQLGLSYGGKTYPVTGDIVRTWANVTPDPKTGVVNVNYDKAAIQAWLKRAVPQVLQSPQTSVVSVVDGSVASRTPAGSGTGLDNEKSANSIMAYLAAPSTEAPVKISLTTKTLTPAEKIARSYTPTSQGLQALINDWQRDHPGVAASVSFVELGGLGRQAGLNPSRLMPTASLYKLFLSVYVLKAIEGGSVSAGEAVVNSKNVGQCIEAMLVVSDNPCGLSLAGRFGWSTLDSFVAGLGFPATSLNQSPVRATTSDTAGFLVKLQAGQLLNPSDTSTMLGYMSRQIHRSAIPAGSPGSSVSDKVGFINNVWNDAAIVRGQHSNYVLVVMTQNGNPAVIKDLALRIHNLIDQ